MAIGPNRAEYLNVPGLAYRNGLATGGYDFLYETSTTQDPKWFLGDRVVLPDGREFRYAKSSGAINTNLACNFTATGYTAYTAIAVAAAVGDRSLTVPAATHAALTADELRGGYVVLGNGGSTVQVRQIVGNAAASSNAAFVIYIDAPLTSALTVASTGVETYQNPFAALNQSVDRTYPKAGVAATVVSAASTYFWVQTKGFTWIAPQAGVGNAGLAGLFYRHDGSVDDVQTALAVTVEGYSTSQYAGVCIEGSASGNGPLIMLQ